MIIPKKSLGQNFLIDNNIANKIINQISIKEKVVLEIGPGYGILTDIIIEKKPKKIILIEKDDKVCEYLINKYRKIKNIEIFNTNILDYDFSHFSKIILISNLPYNISTKLILKLYKYSANVEEMLFMIQKEVANKFDYQKKKMNKYKFLNQLCCDYKICFDVSPKVFKPKPKVKSTVVKFKLKKNKIDWENMNEFLTKIFRNKRKLVSNNLQLKILPIKDKLNKRVEDLNYDEILNLYNFF